MARRGMSYQSKQRSLFVLIQSYFYLFKMGKLLNLVTLAGSFIDDTSYHYR